MFLFKVMLYKYIVNILKDKCPKCSKGSVFLTRFKMKEKCDICDTYFIEKNGDNWFFLLFIDRAFFIFPVVVMLYFGLSMAYMLIGTLISLLVFIYATPFRLGLSLSFDYYMRSNQRSN